MFNIIALTMMQNPYEYLGRLKEGELNDLKEM
jgi:hypothetical protein